MISRRRTAFLAFLLLLGAAVPSVRAEDDAAKSDAPKAAAPAKKKKGAPAKKKGFDYERSKYKSVDLSQSTESSYKWNEKGEPVTGEKKKSAPKKKKRSEPTEEEIRAKAEACGEDSCGEKKSEADAL